MRTPFPVFLFGCEKSVRRNNEPTLSDSYCARFQPVPPLRRTELALGLVPFINQRAMLPVVCCQTMSLILSLLKSPILSTLQPVPAPCSPPALIQFTPFISQTADVPSVCCQTMSLFPSPLKSPMC